MLPDFCFTARQGRAANDTCDAIRPGGALTVQEVVKNPITGAKVFVIDQLITLNLSDIANRGVFGDVWIVVRAYGTGSLFPFIPGIAGVDLADVVEQGSSAAEGGTFPLAVTNPIFVDSNGDGLFSAPFPN